MVAAVPLRREQDRGPSLRRGRGCVWGTACVRPSRAPGPPTERPSATPSQGPTPTWFPTPLRVLPLSLDPRPLPSALHPYPTVSPSRFPSPFTTPGSSTTLRPGPDVMGYRTTPSGMSWFNSHHPSSSLETSSSSNRKFQTLRSRHLFPRPRYLGLRGVLQVGPLLVPCPRPSPSTRLTPARPLV